MSRLPPKGLAAPAALLLAGLLALAPTEAGLRASRSAIPAAEVGTSWVRYVMVGLAGLRGVVSEVLWLRADRLQRQGRYFELVQLCLILKERLKALNFGKLGTNKIFEILTELDDCREFYIRIFEFSFCAKGTTAGNKKLAVFRNYNFVIFKLKSFYKALAQLVQKVERSAKKGNVTANRLTAGKARNSLAYNSLENRSRNILTAGTFVNQRLNISFSKYTTAGSNRINLLHTLGKLVESACICFKQSSHLVNKGTSTTGTSTVHTLLYTTTEICNLGVFTTKLNYNISLWN